MSERPSEEVRAVSAGVQMGILENNDMNTKFLRTHPQGQVIPCSAENTQTDKHSPTHSAQIGMIGTPLWVSSHLVNRLYGLFQ